MRLIGPWSRTDDWRGWSSNVWTKRRPGGVEDGYGSAYWGPILAAWATASGIFGVTVHALPTMDVDDEAWFAEFGSEALHQLEAEYADLRIAAGIVNEFLDQRADDVELMWIVTLTLDEAEGDVASLRDALARCEAAQD